MFEPKFTVTYDVCSAAMIINAPHEPKAVQQTADAIQQLINSAHNTIIYEYTIRAVHAHVAYWLHTAGKYRTCDIYINNECIGWYTIAQTMHDLHPFTIHTTNDLESWYTQFECIHPFEDGNGRVGGIFMAAYSWIILNHMLVPLQ